MFGRRKAKDASDSNQQSDASQHKPVRVRHGCLQAINKAVNGTIERSFHWLGLFVAKFPWVTIILSVLIAAALASGIYRLENETRGEKLWIPSGTESQRDKNIVDDLYPSFGRLEAYYITQPDGGDSMGGNVLTPAAFDVAFAVREGTFDTQFANKPGDDDYVPYFPSPTAYTDICLTRGGEQGARDPAECVWSDVLALFSYDPSRWRSERAILQLLNDPASWNRTTLGQGFVLESVLGGIQRGGGGGGGDIEGAKALAGSFFLAGNATLEADPDGDTEKNGWEQAWLDFIEEENGRSDGYSIERFAGRSFDDEFGGTIDNDVALLQAAIFGIAVYTAIAISNSRDGCVGSRVLLTLGGLINIGLAIAASYGFGTYIGLVFSPLMTILPFIMIGIGADGMFVLQNALDLTPDDMPMTDRVARAMASGGVSVTVASLTNFGAFAIGSNTSLPALSAFSLYAAFSMLFNLLLQITFFAAIMTINKRREVARRWDVLLCVKSSRPLDQPRCKCCHEKPSTMFMRWLGSLLAKRPVQALVIVAWLGLLATGIAGTAQMRLEPDVNNFIPDGSYLNNYFDVAETYFTTEGDSVALYFRSTAAVPVDFAEPQIQAQIDQAIEDLRASEWVVNDSFDSWLAAFRAASPNGELPPAATFYDDLRAFLATPAGRRYFSDVVFADERDPGQGLESCRIGFNWVDVEQQVDKVEAMRETRAVVASIPPPLGTNAFAFGGEFLQVEQYASLGREVVLNLSLAVAMILVVVFLLLANPLASVLTFASVASAICETVGIMYFIGFRIDSVTVIFLVISLGLAVDYSVHVAHGFLAARIDDMQARLKAALADSGAPVINGAASTLIAALFLSGSGSYVFFAFFCALLVVVLAGAFQGLVVLPVLMAVFRPAAHVAVTPRDARRTASQDTQNSAPGAPTAMPAGADDAAPTNSPPPDTLAGSSGSSSAGAGAHKHTANGKNEATQEQ